MNLGPAFMTLNRLCQGHNLSIKSNRSTTGGTDGMGTWFKDDSNICAFIRQGSGQRYPEGIRYSGEG